MSSPFTAATRTAATRTAARALVLFAALLSALPACTYAPRDPAPSMQTVTEVARFEDDQCTGVAVSRTGRLFVCFPTWHEGHRIHVAEVNTTTGDYWPYPSDDRNAWREGEPPAGPDGADRFICVQSVIVDDTDRLWVLDPASPRLAGTLPGARPKLQQFDLATNTLVRTYTFDPAVAPSNSYLNDVRVDTRTGHAFLTDSGLGGLVVLDLNTGAARRVLADHPSTMGEPDVVPQVGGRSLIFASGPLAGSPAVIHSDGIALDTRRGWLYWQALTARTLYRIPTESLVRTDLTEQQLAFSVENLGVTAVTDGMEIDERGNIYLSALEHDAVIVRTPKTDRKNVRLVTLVRSPLIAWPDSFAFGPDGSVYFTTSQIHRTSWFAPDGSMPQAPYRVFRTAPLRR
ncbi:MAG: L-dopachrome tautomerase-related protein [Planctomycetota bacterium]|nr:L-dopachrome tautomerase-related protein [Planctomycetota bacterium]